MGQLKEKEIQKLNYQLRDAPITMPLRTPLSKNSQDIQLSENYLKKEDKKKKR